MSSSSSGTPTADFTSVLTSMPNQARTLLLNRDGNKRPTATFFAEEYVHPNYRALVLPSELLSVRRAIFGTRADNAGMNYMLWQYMRILHSTEYRSYITALDPRITYLHDNDLVDYAFGASITPDDGALQFVGTPELGTADGRLQDAWRVELVGASIRTTRLSDNTSTVTAVTFDGGLSTFVPMHGHTDYKVRVDSNVGSTSWLVDYISIPTSDFDPVNRAVQLTKIGDAAYVYLFPNRGPYKLFKQLWDQHSLFPYKLSGALLALVYRTEEIRRGAQIS